MQAAELEILCRKAVETLRRPGAVLLLPTETVYGLVCRAADETACRRLFELKQRPADKVIGWFVSGSAMLEKYGVILANIVADVIIAMAPAFKKVLEDEGTLICSGIISPRKGEVLTALAENGFALTGIAEKNDWVAIVCTKA